MRNHRGEFNASSDGLIVPAARFHAQPSRTPTSTVMKSFAFIQLARLSPSAVGEASLCLDGSDVLESPALLPSSNPSTSELAISSRKLQYWLLGSFPAIRTA
jgi:hypothetical protein